jgi:hypothetical protein
MGVPPTSLPPPSPPQTRRRKPAIAKLGIEPCMPTPLLFQPTRSRLALAALLLTSLAACGPSKNVFAPACPQPRFVQSLSDLVRFRPGGGQDITDLVLQGRLLRVDGTCAYGDSQTELQTTATVVVDLQRGIAMQGRQADVPIFVAVADGDVVRDKRIYTLHVEFPSNVDRATATSPEIDMTLPISATKSGAAYGIIAGFQLTPDELAVNRQHAAQ